MQPFRVYKSNLFCGEITLREIIFSVFIVGVLFFFGCLIHNKIATFISDNNKKIDQSIRFSDNAMFMYCLDTSPGDAFCEGDLDAATTVSDWDDYVSGEYLAISRKYQVYTRHTRIVHYTTGSGKHLRHHTRTEHYWTWDTHRTDSKMCDGIVFCGVRFQNEKIIGYQNWNDAGVFDIGFHKRYVYETIDKHHHGTVVTSFKNGSIIDSSHFYENKKPDEVAEMLREGNCLLVLFWIFAVIVIGFVLFGFYMLDNRWLESKGKKNVVVNVG